MGVLREGRDFGLLVPEREIRDKLAQVLRQLQVLEKGEAEVLFADAEKARERKDFDKATALYRRVVKEFPQHGLAQASRLRIGECLLGKGEHSLASAHLMGFLRESPLGPYRGHAHLLLGAISLEHAFDARRAEQHFAAVLFPERYDPKSSTTKVPQGWEPPSARPDPTWAEALPDAHERYGLCLYLRRQFKLAENHLAEELRIRPKRPSARGVETNLTAFLLEMCRAGKYPVYFDEQVMVGDSRICTLLFLGSALAEAERREEALALFRRVQGDEFKKSITLPQRAYARMEEGECLRLLLRSKEAVGVLSAFEGALARTPCAPMALMAKAAVHAQAGDTQAAVRAYGLVHSRYPSSKEAPHALYLAGFAHCVNRQPEDARRYYNLLIARYPQSWQAKMVQEYDLTELRNE